MGVDDVASESLHAGCAGLVALSSSISFCEASVPGHLAAASADAVLSGFRACREAGHDLDSLLLVLQTRQIRAHAPPCCPRHTHQGCHTGCPSYQSRPPAAATRCNCLRLRNELLVLAVGIHDEAGGALPAASCLRLA